MGSFLDSYIELTVGMKFRGGLFFLLYLIIKILLKKKVAEN
jgi:hypothetical protein